MRLLIGIVFVVSAIASSVSGTFKYPDGTTVNGIAFISLPRASATDTCSNKKFSFRTVKISIVNGVLPSQTLKPTSCIKPDQKYVFTLYDSHNTFLYRSQWTMPNSDINAAELEK